MKPIISEIVIAVSGSDASIHAAKYAIILAKQYRCRITAVYVVDTATIKHLQMYKIFVPEEGAAYERSLEENGRRYLDFIVRLGGEKGVTIQPELRHGAIYTEVLIAADERNADCIVLGGWEENRSALDIMSRAQREILLHAKCTVLIVKEPAIDTMYDAL